MKLPWLLTQLLVVAVLVIALEPSLLLIVSELPGAPFPWAVSGLVLHAAGNTH